MYDTPEQVWYKSVGAWATPQQGAATSCSTLTINGITTPARLEKSLKYKDTRVVMYADDGIIFSNSLEAIEEVKKLFALAVKRMVKRLLHYNFRTCVQQDLGPADSRRFHSKRLKYDGKSEVLYSLALATPQPQ